MRQPKWLHRVSPAITIAASLAVAVALAVAVVLLGMYIYRRAFSAPSRIETYYQKELIQFLTADDVAVLLTTDADNYVKRLSETDLVARGVKTSAEYTEAIKDLGVTLDPMQKRIAERAILDVQKWLTAPARSAKTVHGVSFGKLSVIPWKIAVTAAKPARTVAYEGNLPHTRGDVVFIPASYIAADADSRLASTLLHEKVHVYQKMYPGDVADALAAEGYKRENARSKVPRIRANPDLDDYIYTDPSGAQMLATYASDAPTGITDVVQTNSAAFEHPYEKMAYAIAAMYK